VNNNVCVHVLLQSKYNQHPKEEPVSEEIFLIECINPTIINEAITMINSTISTTYNERQICLINYLKERVKVGKNFFKSKYIAREIGLSSKEVGTNMGILAEICPEFSIQKYSYSNSTTWLVTASRM
jgi:hypothetical protein